MKIIYYFCILLTIYGFQIEAANPLIFRESAGRRQRTKRSKGRSGLPVGLIMQEPDANIVSLHVSRIALTKTLDQCYGAESRNGADIRVFLSTGLISLLRNTGLPSACLPATNARGDALDELQAKLCQIHDDTKALKKGLVMVGAKVDVYVNLFGRYSVEDGESNDSGSESDGPGGEEDGGSHSSQRRLSVVHEAEDEEQVPDGTSSQEGTPPLNN